MKVTYGAIVQRASGRFGGTVHSNWKGVDVVRRFAAPSNPNSSNQQLVRDTFRNLTKMYQMLPTYHAAAIAAYAEGKKFIARNDFIGRNLPTLYLQADWANLVATPPFAGAVPPSNFQAVGGAGSITTTITIPTPPTGWTVTRGVAGCIKDNQPSDSSLTYSQLTVVENGDATDPYTPTLSGLAAGDYFAWGFVEYVAPDGSTRYSASLMDTPKCTVS